MEDQKNEFFKHFTKKRTDLVEKDCDFLLHGLSSEWERLRDVDRLAVIRIMIEVKHCELGLIITFLNKLMSSSDPYYRYEVINYLVELDGKNQREFLVQVFLNDHDLENRNRALLLLADTFRNQRDKEILHFALSVFDDPSSTIGSRLIAGVALMFQLGIPGDEDGHPVFWNDDEEEIQHPAIQRAVTATREILGG